MKKTAKLKTSHLKTSTVNTSNLKLKKTGSQSAKSGSVVGSAAKANSKTSGAKPNSSILNRASLDSDILGSSLERFEPFERKLTKSQMQQERIIEAAIVSYARKGIEGTSYTTLAADCGISRPLIHHYFPDLGSLFIMAAKYARANHLRSTVGGAQSASHNGWDRLKAYIIGSFDWIEKNPDFGRFWMLYFYQCGLGGEIAKDNRELIGVGAQHITNYLHQMIDEGRKISDVASVAKIVQMITIGGVISVVTEVGNMSVDRAKKLTLMAVETILQGD
jgi:AcrR family transcriptional regulator